MDHRGRAYDNIFIERLWRTLKYENVYPKYYETPWEARIGINEYLHYLVDNYRKKAERIFLLKIQLKFLKKLS